MTGVQTCALPICITGIQAGDIIRVANFLKNRQDVNQSKISAVAFDELGPALIHAAAMDKSIHSISLIGSLISYRQIVANEFYDPDFTKYFVAGALTAYDLPDLIGCIAPRKVALMGINDQMKQPASRELVDEELSFPHSVYSLNNSVNNLNILPATQDIYSVIEWCFE